MFPFLPSKHGKKTTSYFKRLSGPRDKTKFFPNFDDYATVDVYYFIFGDCLTVITHYLIFLSVLLIVLRVLITIKRLILK